MNETSTESVEDRELEELLAGALDAPPVPRSLLKRLDQVVEQEWGQSPRLANDVTSKLQRGLSRSSNWVRGLPIAAALIVVAVGVVFLNSSSPAYAWSAMVEALNKSGLVQLESNGVTRWLSLSEGLACESTGEESVLLDVGKRVLLKRRSGVDVIERQVLAANDSAGRDHLALAFLAGQPGDGFSVDMNSPVTFTCETSSEVSVNGASCVELDVQLEIEGKPSELHVLLDATTHLPIASRLGSIGSEDVSSAMLAAPSRFPRLAYSKESAVALRETAFPTSMAVVDVAPDAETQTASLESTPEKQSPTEAGSTVSPDPVVDKSLADFHGGISLDRDASKWKAVQLVPSVTGDSVKDLDLLLEKLWEQNGVQTVAAATDEELLRRVYLDIAGRTPSVNEVRSYLKDTSADRYERLVDRLLASPEYSSHLSARFRSFLIPEGVDLTSFGGIEAFEKWLAGRFQSGESYDKTVQSLLLAEGRLVQSGPLLFYSATKLEADQLAGRTARVFLGMRLECAQCHDHPFESWKQEDFWGFAAFFARISRPRGKLETVSTVMQVRDVDRGEVMMPDSVAAVPPKFLNEDEVLEDEKTTARRQKLADWLTGSQNPYFARATANRVWSMLFGKGIVNPVDDFGLGNPPISPELLDLLAGQFIQSNFDLKQMFRVVALSKAYRLSSGAEDVNELRQDWFAQMNVKMLTAEQVYDCITVATMPGNAQSNAMTGLVERFGNVNREQFLREFRTPAGRNTEYQGGIPQALTLMNGAFVDTATGLQSSGLLKSLEAPFFNRDQRFEILYFATLSRQPKPSEKALLEQYVTPEMKGVELREALSDILWALLNSAEFTMNH